MDYTVSRASDHFDVVLRGMIDEKSGPDLTRLIKDLAAAKRVVFDCAAVDSINSIGLRLWAEFLKGLKASAGYEYRRCSVYFVDYANMSPSLVEGAKIVSFFAPYRCAACEASSEVLLERQDVELDRFPAKACGKCRGALEPEVTAESYFDFLT